MRHPSILIASLGFLIVSSAACSQSSASREPTNDTIMSPEQQKDADIDAWVDQALQLDPRIAHPERIETTVKEGIVEFSGTADSLLVKKYATLEAEKIAGVRGVINKLALSPSYRSDDEIRADIVRRLSERPSLHLKRLKVDVSDGVATVRGTVSSLGELKRVEAIVSEIQGVHEITDRLGVSYRSQVSDEDNRDQIVAALDMDPYLTGIPITVKVSDGVAVLDGKVGNLYERRRAEEDVWRVASVREVVNDMDVDWSRSRGTRDSRPNPTDDQIRRAVEDALLQDLRIERPDAIAVSVHDGIAELQGTAPDWYEKNAIDDDARNIVGVEEVADLIQIRREPRREDDQIAYEIRRDLETDYLLSDRPIEVKVHDGDATLSGRVETPYEEQHAEAVARRALGVREVMDELSLPDHAAFTDAALTENVRSRLRADWKTAGVADDIRVRIDQGDVTLTGWVDSWSERMEAARVAASVDGVRQVQNKLEVGIS